MNTSKIEWTEKTWNPLTGCTKVDRGCKFCYAETVFNNRLATNKNLKDYYGRKFTDVFFHEERLNYPFSLRTPQMIFVNSMSDIFHESVPFQTIGRIFDVMCSQMLLKCNKCKRDNDPIHEQDESCFRQLPIHIYQVLTKRAERMEEWLWWMGENWDGDSPFNVIMEMEGKLPDNIWMGVSVGDQESADKRIPELLKFPASIRWVSYEPAYGPVDFTQKKINYSVPTDTDTSGVGIEFTDPGDSYIGLDWIVMGAESGWGKTAQMDLVWADKVMRDCRNNKVPFFMKQIVKDHKKIAYEDFPDHLKVRQYPEMFYKWKERIAV